MKDKLNTRGAWTRDQINSEVRRQRLLEGCWSAVFVLVALGLAAGFIWLVVLIETWCCK